MISNHTQFIEAIHERKLIQIEFYSLADAGTVNRVCVPLDYGPEPGGSEALNRYWIWDDAATAGSNPLGLGPDQIVAVQVLGKTFDPEKYHVVTRPWSVLREWTSSAHQAGAPSGAAGAPLFESKVPPSA